MSRRVIDGDRIRSPTRTARTAATSSSGDVSLTRKPAAPSRRAAYTNSSASNVVSTTTTGGVGCWSTRRVAANPSRTGIRMSMSTRSGRSSRANRTASTPSPASPTTMRSDWCSRMDRNPARTSCWSSASSTLVMGSPPTGSPLPLRIPSRAPQSAGCRHRAPPAPAGRPVRSHRPRSASVPGPHRR